LLRNNDDGADEVDIYDLDSIITSSQQQQKIVVGKAPIEIDWDTVKLADLEPDFSLSDSDGDDYDDERKLKRENLSMIKSPLGFESRNVVYNDFQNSSSSEDDIDDAVNITSYKGISKIAEALIIDSSYDDDDTPATLFKTDRATPLPAPQQQGLTEDTLSSRGIINANRSSISNANNTDGKNSNSNSNSTSKSWSKVKAAVSLHEYDNIKANFHEVCSTYIALYCIVLY
jgi:hypothetical protein